MKILEAFKDATKSLVRNKWLTVVSILSVMVTLFIVSVFGLIILNVNNITKNIESDIEAVVYLDLNIKESEFERIELEISQIKNVKDIQFINKEKGLDTLVNDLGERGKAFESLREDNPLNDAFIVKPTNTDAIEELSSQLKLINGVDSVDYGKNVVDELLNLTNIIRNVGLTLIVGLMVTALLLISNTIKNSIDIRRNEIKIMRLVGASNTYITLPFVIEGVLIGIVGSIIPLIVVFGGYYYILEYYTNIINVPFMDLLSITDVSLVIITITLGISVLIGILGSMISIRKYLKI